MNTPKTGLEDISIGQQDISFLDGERGELIYRGYSIDTLAAHAAYEEVVFLLWRGHLPTAPELASFRAELAAARDLPAPLTEFVRGLPAFARPMDVLRTGVSLLGLLDAGPTTFERAALLPKAAAMLATMPMLMAAFWRHRQHLPPVEPRPELGHAAGILWRFSGQEPAPEAVAALNLYLVLLADLELNASAFACRVTAATWADIYAAVVSGIGTLSGHAHGGAVQQVMLQLAEIGAEEHVDAWFEAAVASKRRIMGIGHRVFKVLDPRAPHLKTRVEALAGQTEQRRWFNIAAALEARAAAHPFFQQRRLVPNVDYYAAPLLNMLGLEPDMFTTIFAISRVAGWSAHIMHQYEHNRLIRPRTEYVGPRDLPWVPIEAR